MPTIQVRLFATLSAKSPPDAAHFPITEGATLAWLLERIGITKKDARLIFINGVKAGMDQKLSNGDKVGIFPPVGGG